MEGNLKNIYYKNLYVKTNLTTNKDLLGAILFPKATLAFFTFIKPENFKKLRAKNWKGSTERHMLVLRKMQKISIDSLKSVNVHMCDLFGWKKIFFKMYSYIQFIFNLWFLLQKVSLCRAVMNAKVSRYLH